jgi:hypothetical protein
VRHLKGKCGSTELSDIPEHHRRRERDDVRDKRNEENAQRYKTIDFLMFHELLLKE